MINQIAFSPRDNLLAWTDESGALSRWYNPILSSLPDPVKKTIGAGTSASRSVQRDVSDLFDVGEPTTGPDDVDMEDLDLDMGDDWIIDDLPDTTKSATLAEGFVKEMGA